jgi:NADH:ubiquinone oxidoreductase subunit D
MIRPAALPVDLPEHDVEATQYGGDVGQHVAAVHDGRLIHHFKLSTEGFHLPAGEVYAWWRRPRASSASTSSPTDGLRS